MNNTYPAGIWNLQIPVNNFDNWLRFYITGFYTPANDCEERELLCNV
jgi:hypothetical protein